MANADRQGARTGGRGARWAALLGFAIAPAIVVLAAALMFASLSQVARESRALQQSFETREQIQRLYSLLQDAETGQRGYVITGDRSFLQPYVDAYVRLDAQLRRVDGLVAGEPEQVSRLHQLDLLIESKHREMALVIRMRDERGASAAAAYVSGARGKRIMDEIRSTVREMDGAESARVAAAAQKAQARRVQVRATAGFLILLLGSTLAVAGVLSARHTRMRQRLVERLEEQTQRQAALFASTIDAIVTLNPSGSIESCNPAAETMFGYPADELLRRDSSLLLDLAPGEGLFLRRLARRAGEGFSGLRELTARRRDGSLFPVEVALGAMPLKDGVHLVAAIRDISDRREADRVKDEFISTVSHELRTPLTSIAGSLALIHGGAAGVLPERATRLVSIAKVSCDRLVRLINDLLDLQKIGSGQLQMDSAALDLREVAQTAIEAVSGLAAGREARIACSLPEHPLAVRGDADRLVQVLVNLLSNALKFSPPGQPVELTARADAGHAVVSVRDHGPGVPEAFQASLFRRFSQADGSATRSVGGSGLGLAISKEIVERHEGHIRLARSGPDGAAFEIRLPLAGAGAAAAPSDAARAILVCDPRSESAGRFRAALAAAGLRQCDVVAPEALEAELAPNPPALLVLAGQQPPVGAVELLERLQGGDGVRLPPVIVVAAESDVAAARGLPIATWLTMPVENERLRVAIAEALADRSSAHVLHVDDDVELTSLVSEALLGVARVTPAHTLAAAREAMAAATPDLVILDIGLPDGSGLTLLPQLAGLEPPPRIVVYSGQEGDPDRLAAVEAVLTKSRVSFETLTDTVRTLIA